MSDHLDAHDGKSPRMDPRLDICDLYAFQSPGDPGRTVLVLNVNPFAPTGADAFHPDAIYEILVVSDGNADSDLAFRFTFSEKEGGKQLATLRMARGGEAQSGKLEGDVLFKDLPVDFDGNVRVSEQDGFRLYVGMRSDPFFFDLKGYLNGMQFTGDDFFLDKNVFSMVLELPNSEMGSDPRVNIWARVMMPKNGSYIQVDRMGHPFMNVGFTAPEDKDAFNQNVPARDRELFTDKVVKLLVSKGRDPDSANREALKLLPDVLSYDRSRAAGYPNGRTLRDDIIDHQLAILTNGKVTTDRVGPHDDLVDDFPYLGSPRPIKQEIKESS